MSLKERWNAECSTIGKILMNASAIAGILIPILAEGSEYSGLLPEGFVPVWVKTVLGLLFIYGMVQGKMTVKKDL